MNPLDQYMQMYMKQGYNPHPADFQGMSMPTHPILQGLRQMNYRQPGSNLGGYVSSADKANENMFLNQAATEMPYRTNTFHEAEHLRGFRQPTNRWDMMAKDVPDFFEKDTMTAPRYFMKNVLDNADYLKRKFPEVRASAYLSKDFLDDVNKGKRSPDKAFEELIATLSSIEQSRGIDLTEDPMLKGSLFKDPRIAESYRSMTGWRSSRWDAKDPESFTFREDLLKNYIKGK